MKKMLRPFCKDRQIRCAATLPSLLLLFALTGVVQLKAQIVFASNRTANYQTQRLTLSAKNTKLAAVMERIEKQARFYFVYSPDDINVNQRISVDVRNEELNTIMDLISHQIDAEFEIINDKIILRKKSSAKPQISNENIPQTEQLKESSLLSFQNLLITGQVTDESGKALSGVSVYIKGTGLGTTTNEDGRFSLSIPESHANDVVIFSFVGYSEKQVRLNGQNNLNITLTPSERSLEDVVVIGYGTQRRATITGSVDKVTRAAIDGKPAVTLSQALQGTSPNLIIQQRNFEPGQPVNLNIRGLSTLGDNTPLVVIDGIVGGDINLINPNDIESVSILKDAGSAAIYGSRSANGVILITTKKGRKNERPALTYNGIYGVQTPHVTYEPVHAWENAYFKNESLVNSGQQPIFKPEDIQRFKEQGDGDWQLKNILQDAKQQSHNISIQGGGTSNAYMLSFGYINQENNFVGPDYGLKRYSIRLNQSTDIGKLKVNTILSYIKNQIKDHSYNAGTLIVDASRVPLYYSFQDSLGRYLTNPVSAQFNPKAILEQGGYRRSNDDEVFGTISGEYSLLRDLKIQGLFGGTVRSNTGFSRRMQLNFIPGGVYGDDREVADNNYKSLLTNTQLLAEYSHRFGDHNVKVLFGGTNESFKSEGSNLTRQYTDPNLGTPTTGTQVSNTASYNSNQATSETSINSLLGRVNYSLHDKYFAQFSFRYDGSSNFAKDNRWGFFPSGSLAWNITNESFLSNVKNKIGTIKLRASYGLLGNQNVRPYQYQTSYFNYSNAYGFNNQIVGGAGYSLGNPQLTWEKAATFNLGADLQLLKRKLDLSLDYFDKRTRDILVPRKDIPLLFGAAFPDFNTAEVRNRGWEIKASYNTGKVFRQSFTLNLADNLNELVSFTFDAKELIERKEEFELLRRVGQPITVYYGYKINGFFQNLDDLKNAPIFAGQNRSSIKPGDLKFVDRNGDGVINDEDKFILGNPFPRYTFGFTYTGQFKGFDLVLFIQGVGKRDAMIRGEQVEPFHFGYGGTMYRHQTDYWTPSNPDARWPRLAEAGSPSNTNNFRTGSDLYLFDAAYARLKNIQIGYSLPAKWMERVKMQGARIYLTGQNLYTLTKLNFLDPEITEFDNNTNFGAGANSARAYPLPIFYGFGIDLRF